MHGGKAAQIDLVLNLNAVASIYENTGLITQSRAKSGGPGKPRQPRQTIIARGHVFTLVNVRAWDQKSIDALNVHDAAQGLQSGGAVFGARAHGEVLKH